MQHPGNSLLMITQSGEVFGVELRAWKLNANCKRSTTFQLLPIVWHIKQGAQLWCYRIKKKESTGWNKCIMQNVSPLFIPVIPHKCESHILTSFWMRNFLLDSLLNLCGYFIFGTFGFGFLQKKKKSLHLLPCFL